MLSIVTVIAVAIAAFALAIAAWSLAVMARQLSVARSSSGGRALLFLAGRSGKIEQPVRFTAPGRIAELPEYVVKASVGGPGVFHHVAIHVLGIEEDANGDVPEPPAPRITMTSADDPIEWRFSVASWEHAANGWAVLTWVRPYLEGVASDAVAQCLNHDHLYKWRWYHPRSQRARITVRNWARKHARVSWNRLRTMPVYGEWQPRRRTNPIGVEGPVGLPPPCD